MDESTAKTADENKTSTRIVVKSYGPGYRWYQVSLKDLPNKIGLDETAQFFHYLASTDPHPRKR